MDAGDVVRLAPDRPDLVGLATVGTNLLVDDHRAEFVLFHRLEDLLELFRLRIGDQCANDRIVLLVEFEDRRIAREVDERRFALRLLDDAHRLADFLGEVLAHPLIERRIGREQRVLALFLADSFRQLVDRGNDLLDLFVRVGDRAQEDLLGDLFGAAFDHHHRIGRAGDDDLHPAALVLFEGRVGDEAAALIASDADRGDVFLERDIADREARNLAGRVHLLFVIAGEGKEVDPLPRFLRRRCGAEDDDLIAVADEGGPVGLLRKLSRLNDERTATDLERDGFWH